MKTAIVYTSICWSRFVSRYLWENMRRQMPKAPSFRFYFHFLLIVKWLIKMFTSINLAQSLHVCKPLVQTCACVISIGSPSWLETEIFPTLRRNQLPCPPYRKHTEPWHHCVPKREFIIIIILNTTCVTVCCRWWIFSQSWLWVEFQLILQTQCAAVSWSPRLAGGRESWCPSWWSRRSLPVTSTSASAKTRRPEPWRTWWLKWGISLITLDVDLSLINFIIIWAGIE